MNFYEVQKDISDMLGEKIMSKDVTKGKGSNDFSVVSININQEVEDTDTTAELADVSFKAVGKDTLKDTLDSFKQTLEDKYGDHVYSYIYHLKVNPISNQSGQHNYTGNLFFMYSKELEDAYVQKITLQ